MGGHAAHHGVTIEEIASGERGIARKALHTGDIAGKGEGGSGPELIRAWPMECVARAAGCSAPPSSPLD